MFHMVKTSSNFIERRFSDMTLRFLFFILPKFHDSFQKLVARNLLVYSRCPNKYPLFCAISVKKQIPKLGKRLYTTEISSTSQNLWSCVNIQLYRSNEISIQNGSLMIYYNISAIKSRRRYHQRKQFSYLHQFLSQYKK